MRYTKFAIAAGASMVVAAKLSPAYALPPGIPLDINGPVRQGTMCKVSTHVYEDAEAGWGYFRECGPQRTARHHHRDSYREPVYAADAPQYAIRPAVYRPLELIGPMRQGHMCKVSTHVYEDAEPGWGYFRECGPHEWLPVAYRHYRHAHHAHHHHRHHVQHVRHHARHAQVFTTLTCDALKDVEALQPIQQVWQPSYSTDIVELVTNNAIETDGVTVRAAAEVARGEIGGTVSAELAIPNDGGMLAQLFAADQRSASELDCIAIEHGPQITDWILSPSRVVIPARTGDRPRPIESSLSSATVLGHQRSPQPQHRYNNAVADQSPLTSDGYSTPIRSEAGATMPIAMNDNGVSPVAAAVFGLALILAAPLALVATHLTVTVPDKAAVIETVSDPFAEAEWYGPAKNPVVAVAKVTRF